MLKRQFLKLLVCALVLVGWPAPGFWVTQALAAGEGSVRINLAGRQRMLSQRMAKAACFAALGIDAQGHLEMAASAHSDFGTVLTGLREGDDTLGLEVEKNLPVLSALDVVDALWAQYGHAVAQAIEQEDVDLWILAAINSLKVETLVKMNMAVTEIVSVYAAKGVDPQLAQTINVAGRQRMLSQKASAELCLIVQGLGADVNRGSLRKTVSLFNSSLASLREGTNNLTMPPKHIAQQLSVVAELWEPMAKILDHTAMGGLPSMDEVTFVAERNNIVLVEMNRAVGMYADLSKGDGKSQPLPDSAN